MHALFSCDKHLGVQYYSQLKQHFAGKVVAKFCAKFLHQQVLKSEDYAAGDIGTSVQKAFFRFWHLFIEAFVSFYFSTFAWWICAWV